MLKRQEVSLLVSSLLSVSVRSAITKELSPYVRIIEQLEVCGTIYQTSIYDLLESVLGAKGC